MQPNGAMASPMIPTVHAIRKEVTMRTIKFRDQRADNREWVFGSLGLKDNKAVISCDRIDSESNAEIKERLISRLIRFKNKFKKGWNGNAELPMEEQSVSNALADTEVASTEEFVKWTAFPPPNGTILFSSNEIKSIMQQLGIEARR